uniref:Amine oxidase domain-containing protein n=1 Tax=Alexandrium monilatum TaxID=311494 RepID=A0A7S4QRH2_9DINO
MAGPRLTSAQVRALPPLCLAAALLALRHGASFSALRPGAGAGRRVGKAGRQGTAAESPTSPPRKKVVVIGAGWGGLGAAHHLSKDPAVEVTIVDAAPRPGGLVTDGFTTPGGRRAEAGIHGFWDEYANIFSLVREDLGLTGDKDPFTGYADQGQYSPKGLEAVWPVYREQQLLPTGLGQAVHTKFLNLSPLDRASAAPLTLAFSEFDDSPEAWERYDRISFRDLCQRLGVSRKMYDEAFEPMILTGLFAPGEQCSAAAALGMAYFFVLKQQNAFDVRWCRGNVGEKIFQPWVEALREQGNVDFLAGCRAVDFIEAEDGTRMSAVRCRRQEDNEEFTLEADEVVFAVGMGALKAMARVPALAKRPDFAKFGNLRGTDVLATRIWLDRVVDTPYWANACWGFDEGVGMTWFDIGRLHAPAHDGEPGSVIEMDFYHAGSLLPLSDEALVDKAKSYLDTMVPGFRGAKVVEAAVVRLPSAVNWYFPGSYRSCPDTRASSFENVYFAGDVVRTRHGSWSQEKAYVTGIEAANAILGRRPDHGVKPLKPTEPHVQAGRAAVKLLRGALSGGKEGKGPSLADFLW